MTLPAITGVSSMLYKTITSHRLQVKSLSGYDLT